MDFDNENVLVSDVLSKRLQEEIVEFRDLLKENKKSLKKSDLVNLAIALVENPVEATVEVGPNIAGIFSAGARAKQTLIHLTIKGLEERVFDLEGDNDVREENGLD